MHPAHAQALSRTQRRAGPAEDLGEAGQGASIALVSDAGTPLISDPGFKLVREVCAAGHRVTALPGPSSVLTALSLAALPTDRFFFEGFLPSKQTARRSPACRACANRCDACDARVRKPGPGEALRDLAEIMGTRDGAICREMTKCMRRSGVRRLPNGAIGGGDGDARRVRARDRPTGGRCANHGQGGARRTAAIVACKTIASRMQLRTRWSCRACRAAKSMLARSN